MRSLASMLLLLLATAFASAAIAQDIPGRVGRISYIDGSVGLYQDPDRGWDAAYVNSPVTSRNSVWTEPGARAEVVIGPMALRLDEATQLDLSVLDDATLDAILESGTATMRIRHFRRGDVVRLSTPRASFLLQAEGRYRVDADPDRGESRLSVFSGAAVMETSSGTVRIPVGQSVVVWGDEHAEYAFQDAYATDFDRWTMARDERWIERRAPTYVSYEMTGYEDLDTYGEWAQDATYGELWFPTRVEGDWAPYRDGHWSYVRPWGWTWIDSQPWGYAPFHYGRWLRVRDRWAWCPGQRVDRPAWAPALVGFIGGGSFSASVASGSGPVVGWYPLAPSEQYHPWYSASRNYVSRVNAAVRKMPAAVERQHIEANRDRGATVVRRETLVQQRPVRQAMVSVAQAAVRSAPVAATPTSILPSREEIQRARHERAAQAPAPAPRARAPAVGGAPSNAPAARQGAALPATAANAIARPSFAKPSEHPRPAPKGAAPPAPNAPVARIAPSVQPPQRGAASPAEGARAAQQREQDARAARDAQQRNEKAASDAAQQQRAAQEQQRATQQQERAAQEQQKAAAQQQQRAAEEQQKATAQQQQRAAQEQQQRAARDAAQQQQRAAQEQQKAVAQEQQKAAAQQQQRAAQEQQQRAARDAAQQQQRAAQEQQKAAAQQQQQRAAQEQQKAAAQQEAAQRAQQAGRAPPQARGDARSQEERDKDKEKEKEKEKEKGSGR